jgi:uncharacterized repeat protein (TIGR03943 family)
VNRQAQAVVLLLVGGAILRASLTDLYTRYVKEGLQPFLIVAGAVLVAAAIATLWYELRPRRAAVGAVAATHDGDAHGGDDGHGHAREPWVAWLLVLPVFALLLAPPALGSYAANRSGTALQEVSQFPRLPDGDPVKISVVDYATRAVYDEGRSLMDRRVQLSGFVLKASDGTPYLVRIVLSCCAADGRPVKIGMTGNVPAGLADNSWLEITGRYTEKTGKDEINGGVIPYITVEEARPIDAPKNQYEA